MKIEIPEFKEFPDSNISGRMIFNNYGFFRRLILVIAGMGLKGWKDYKKEK